MFTVYVDDSGTSPDQKVAVATALVIPAKQIPAMEVEWANLKEKEHFSCFHMSEFVARNPKTEFATWDQAKQQRVFNRVNQITNKYGVRGFSFAVNKQDYDEIVVGDWRACFGGQHYTWALRHALSFADDWRNALKLPPLEYIFDWMGKPSEPHRREVEEMMELAESLALQDGKNPDEFTNYTFKSLKDLAGLQCVDMAGWVSYQIGLRNFKITSQPVHPFVEQAIKDFESRGRWMLIFTVIRANLEAWFKNEQCMERSQRFIKKWRDQKGGKAR